MQTDPKGPEMIQDYLQIPSHPPISISSDFECADQGEVFEMSFDHDLLTGRIIDAIITVHSKLGPGYLESIYQNSMMIELRKQGLVAEAEREFTVLYDGEEVGLHRLDILVEETIVLELKVVEQLMKKHYAQVRSYLKATGCRTGLLVNFAGEKADFRRIDND